MAALIPPEHIISVYVMNGTITQADIQAEVDRGASLEVLQAAFPYFALRPRANQVPQQKAVSPQLPPDEPAPLPMQSPPQPPVSTGGGAAAETGAAEEKTAAGAETGAAEKAEDISTYPQVVGEEPTPEPLIQSNGPGTSLPNPALISQTLTLFDQIPEELKARAQWMPWRYEYIANKPKPKKRPMNPRTGRGADWTTPANWGTYADAIAALSRWKQAAGIGYVLTDSDGLVGIDLDRCRNPETGDLDPWACEIVELLNSYTEISPSGTGIHIILKGALALPNGKMGTRSGQIEVYQALRFLTMTGNRLDSLPPEIQERQSALNQFLRDYFPQALPPPTPPPGEGNMFTGGKGAEEGGQETQDSVIPQPAPAQTQDSPQEAAKEAQGAQDTEPPLLAPEDQAVLNRMFAARNGGKAKDLWDGKWQALGYSSQSEADQALCTILAFYTQDPAQIDRLFRQSALYRSDKWEREDYRDRTIKKALKLIATQRSQPPAASAPAPNAEESRNAELSPNSDGAENGRSVKTEKSNQEAPLIDGSRGFAPYDGATLRYKDFPPRQEVIPDLLPVGLSVLAGAPKLGKSFMALNIACAVASGGKAFGYFDVTAAEVLYLALEDSQRRMQDRLLTQLGDEEEWPKDRLYFVHNAPLIGAGLEEQITGWMAEHPQLRLVVIDTFARVRPPRQKGQDLYQEDYRISAQLQQLALNLGIAILLVHHNKKGHEEDFISSVSGSHGVTGAADSVWKLNRKRGESAGILSVTGRDIEERDIAMKFVDGVWRWVGDPTEARRSESRKKILDALTFTDRTPREIANATGMKGGTVRQLLMKMLTQGEVAKDLEIYSLPTNTP